MADSQEADAGPSEERRAAARAHLRALGISVKQWADRHGYRHQIVYKVLNGQLRCHFGTSHEIAVKLGLKDGELRTDDQAAADV